MRARRVLAWCIWIAAAGLIGLGLAALYDSGRAPEARVRLGPAAPPPLPENLIRPLTAEQAVAANAAIATSAEPVEAASPFLVAPALSDVLSRGTALDCLTAAIYYEAASETVQGQRGVAQVVLNRVRHPAFPHSVCGVVYQGSERKTGCQFSFTCDGSLARRPSRAAWDRAAGIAAAALNGWVEPSVGTATHYHTVWILPYWADSLTKLATVGAHIFYRWPGYWGRRAAFSSRYQGEPQELALGSTEAAIELPAATATDFLAADNTPLTRLLADEAKGQLALPGNPAASSAAVAADSQAGKLLADEASGTLYSNQGGNPEARPQPDGTGQ